MPPWFESILGVTVEEVQLNQVHLEWTETFSGLRNGCTTPGVPLDIPVESASS